MPAQPQPAQPQPAQPLPALFISHGPPNLLLTDDPTTMFLRGLSGALAEGPRAILVVSAHWETEGLAITTRARQEALHDYSGFPAELYSMTYTPPSDGELVQRSRQTLEDAGYSVAKDSGRPLDHGAWMPLKLMYPEADIPVVQLSLPRRTDPQEAVKIGQALAPLRAERILILASGNLTHNLREAVQRFHFGENGVPEWVRAFQTQVFEAVRIGDLGSLLSLLDTPTGRQNHPTAEHFLPFYLALGAGMDGQDLIGARLHDAVIHDVLAMDAYAFGGPI